MIQIRIGGWAGQGVVLAGTILSQTFSTVMKKNVVMTRSYTAAVRSGITTSDILVDDEYIYDLMITEPTVMIIMYQKTFDRYIDLIKKSKYVIVDSAMVKNIPYDLKNVFSLNASKIAEEISNPRISNVVLLGAYAKITGQVPFSALEESLKKYVPKKFLEDDLKAIYAGYSL